jgi:hypothetical protein
MQTKEYTAIVKIKIDEGRVKEIKSWNEEFSVEEHLATILTDKLKDTGLMLKAEVFPIQAYDELCQTSLRFMENNALADIEDEILNKSCIGGNCED